MQGGVQESPRDQHLFGLLQKLLEARSEFGFVVALDRIAPELVEGSHGGSNSQAADKEQQQEGSGPGEISLLVKV